MKHVLLILTASLMAGASFAQQETNPPGRFDFRINAGTTFTFVPDFNNYMVLTSGMVVPGYIHPSNAWSSNSAKASSTSKSAVGWHAEAEVHYNLPRSFSLSVGAGVKKMRFNYASEVMPIMGITVPEKIDDMDRRFGETSLLYLSITPLNISKQFMRNRLAVQVGPVLNWLLKGKSTNTVLVYNSQQSAEINSPDRAYFDTIGNTRDRIWGANLSIAYKVANPVAIKISGQYYVNSLYEDEAYGFDVEKIKPFVLQAGVSIAPFAF